MHLLMCIVMTVFQRFALYLHVYAYSNYVVWGLADAHKYNLYFGCTSNAMQASNCLMASKSLWHFGLRLKWWLWFDIGLVLPFLWSSKNLKADTFFMIVFLSMYILPYSFHVYITVSVIFFRIITNKSQYNCFSFQDLHMILNALMSHLSFAWILIWQWATWDSISIE